MRYKSYEASIEFDDTVQVFHGRVLGIRDIISFEGTTIEELQRGLEDAINTYLESYKEDGVVPEKG